ncbi:4-alpha-glucanotransferase [Streptomyces sp. VRA16 Mangrove soil]|uniref:4-alpha-glucanotransferase n=1 Tax=Streptomyces sp. VRA16 Mangrove soil TaxID=2817434 RepID=UPI001A9D69D6|nr:4-alpha-glucanotransferase [Streptomyces sp. VRA16 Mangrove soil]MBO1334025.1 4-alpha-glucanotransferase [Streptomyces sp. VRA16 Mangrove soil]
MSLARLAELYGVAPSYSPAPGQTVRASDAALTAALAALGVDAADPDALAAREAELAGRLLPPTVVWWLGGDEDGDRARPGWLAELPEGVRLFLTLESQGERVGGWETPGREPPPGVHRLTAETPDGRTAEAHLVAAPRKAPRPAARTHGLLVQLYSLLSTRSWGMGDLADLADLAAWSARTHGTGFLQVNPLHAAVPAAPGGTTDPSPYRPSSRRFPDPVHLRIEDIPEYAYVPARTREAAMLREEVLGKGELIDRDAVWALKRDVLETLVRDVPLTPGRRAAYCDYLAEQGAALEDHATYQALAERHGPEWHTWPAPLRDPHSPETARARQESMDRVDFHCRLAWLTDTQLAAAQRTAREAGMPIGLVHDLAVGVHPGGADAWAQRDVFAQGMSVGAPPDAFNARGQDWGLPPWRPDRLAATGYAPFRGLLRHLMRHAGAVRIDHVMGLFRLWWVPAGEAPTEGCYVHYDAEAMLAVLLLEAARSGTYVIGEDLGTVEPGVRETLREHGVLGTSVLWFERDWEAPGQPAVPAEQWRTDCVATATTHDLPSTAARLTGDDVRLRERLGLSTGTAAEAAAEVADWLGLFARLGLLPGGSQDEEEAVRAVHRFLLRTPARMIGVWLPDLVGDRRPQNLPGTWDEYPNWRLPVADAAGHPVTLEDLAASPRAHALLDVFRGFGRADDGTDVPLTGPPDARLV